MDLEEAPRATVALHAPARAFAPGTQIALARLGYRMVAGDSPAAHATPDPRCRPTIRIVDDRQIEKLPLAGNGLDLPIILLASHRGPLATDTRAVGTVRRRAGVNELFALLQRALERWPRAVPRVSTALPARCTHRNHGWAGAIRSISENGCLLLSTECLVPDARLDLCFALPGAGLMHLPAQPIHVCGKRVGLAFQETPEQSRSAIAGYVTAQLTSP